MEAKQLLHSITVRGLLSFGPEGETLDLKPLNVIIGPNASGKSNLIEAIGLLKATPGNLAKAISQGGGIGDWLWKGTAPQEAASPQGAEIETVVNYPEGETPLRYRIRFTMVGQRLEIIGEWITNHRGSSETEDDVRFSYEAGTGAAVIRVRSLDSGVPAKREWRQRENGYGRAILAELRDPKAYPEITYLGDAFRELKLYTDWNVGSHSRARHPQKPDLPSDFLLEDASNLGLIINDFEHKRMKDRLVEPLKNVYAEVEDVTTKVYGGTIETFIHEEGLVQPIPAGRLSDGTLRFLCLAVLLRHPSPPPLLCIEEPELGLHPDVLRTVAELLVEASQRTQLIVTTHSESLVSSLSDAPESVVVCERDSGGTHFQRLDPDHLKEWLEKYSLGDLWRMGEIGGNRW